MGLMKLGTRNNDDLQSPLAGPVGPVSGMSQFFLPPHSSLLTPHSSLLTPHSSLLTPHSSHLTPHTSLLTPHSSLLTPHTSLLDKISSYLSSTKPYNQDDVSNRGKTDPTVICQCWRCC